jgi:lysozyme family protein
MASFDLALQRTLKYEGGYVDDPNDPGGETYCGISRRAHPDWNGWKRIDVYKQSPIFPGVLENDAALKGWRRDFYRDEYWSLIAGDKVLAQSVAEELFDTAVHMGPKRAVRFLQTALNVLNRDEKLYPNMKVDGKLGPKTLATLETYQGIEPPAFLVKLLVIQRGAFYVAAVKKREESEAYLRGWLRRVKVR